jgi:plasmid stabilization system protein ParE
MTVHHLLEAEVEILEVVTFYQERSGDLAADFYKEFKRAREEIATFPEFWGLVGGGYRRKLMDRYPYGIIYKVEGEEILIVALAHTSRHPEYWKGR